MTENSEGKEDPMYDDISGVLLRILEENQAEDDMRIFLQWYAVSQENRDIFFQLKHIYHLRKGGLMPDEMEMEASWERLWAKLGKKFPTYYPPSEAIHRRGYVRIALYAVGAAIVFLLIVTGERFFYDRDDQMEWVEVSTETGTEPKAVVLPDGSVVRLNASSLFRYPEKFNSTAREVYLDGEACFSVAKDDRHSFVVHTDKQYINVLATEFNVLGYSSDPYTITTLVTGRVKLGTYDSENNLKNEIVMYPNQQVYFDKEFHRMTLSEVNASDAISWTQGIYSFRDTPLEEIVRRFEKIYGVTVIIPDEADRKEEYTGKFFSRQTINEIVDVLNFKRQFRVEFGEDTICLRKK